MSRTHHQNSSLNFLLLIIVAILLFLVWQLNSPDSDTNSSISGGSVPLGSGSFSKAGDIQGSNPLSNQIFSPQAAASLKPGDLNNLNL